MQGDDRASITLRLPATLSTFSGGKGQIAFRADTIEELLAEVKQQYPQLWERLCDVQGYLRPDVKMFVNNEVIAGRQGLEMELMSGQEVIVLPSISRN